MEPKITNKRAIVSWAIFDWANSAFPSIVITFIFSTYFATKIASNKIIGTAQWGETIGFAGLIIAILSPILGAIADNEGRRKPLLALFTLFCVIASAGLWYAYPHPNYAFITLVCVALGTIGMEVSMVFYNSMLSDIAPGNYLGRISGWAWGLGYFGGLVSMLLVLFLFINEHTRFLPLDTSSFEQIRITGPLCAIWIVVFGWPLFIYTPDQPSKGIGKIKAMRLGLSTLFKTLTQVRQYKNVMLFLIARMLYIDGLNTIFAFGGIYAAGTFHFTLTQVLMFGIFTNISAGIGAAIFGWVDDALGAKLTISVTLIIILAALMGLLVSTTVWLFWVFGMMVSFCVGPIQAASRSLLIRIAPKEIITEMFGLYAFSGKATAFLGPWLVGVVTYATDNQRAGMATVIVFLSLGAMILYCVKEKKG